MPAYKRRYQKKKASRPTDRIIRAGSVTLAAATQGIGYLYEASTPQTVTNFRLDTGPLTSMSAPVAYVLVYIPEGYNANNITFPATTDDMYNPSKSVILSGVIVTNQQDHKYSRYSRKMAPGDRLALLYLNTSAEEELVSYEINFTAVY